MRRVGPVVLFIPAMAWLGLASSQSPPSSAPAQSTTRSDAAVAKITGPWTGDLDGMIARRYIRVATTYNRTHYFIDKGVQRGIVFESMKLFEDDVNLTLKSKNIRVSAIFIPMSREELLPAVVEGRADVAAAALTVTPARRARVDFSVPTRTAVDEIVVTGPGAPQIASAADLAGREVFVRPSSAYSDSLRALSARLEREGKKAIVLKPAPETLEDDDLLEMVNAGLVKIAVVDNYLAEFWKQLLPNLVLHPDVAVAKDGVLAVAMRKNSPQLMTAVNGWIAKHGPKSTFGNLITQRYLKSAKFAKNATSPREIARFQRTVEFFRKYGQQYNLDYLLMGRRASRNPGSITP